MDKGVYSMDYDAEVERLFNMKSKKACVMECMRMLSELPAAQWYGYDLCKLRFCEKHCFTNSTQAILKPASPGAGKADLSEIVDWRGNRRFYRDKVKLGNSWYVVSNGIARGPQKWGSDNLRFLVRETLINGA